MFGFKRILDKRKMNIVEMIWWLCRYLLKTWWLITTALPVVIRGPNHEQGREKDFSRFHYPETRCPLLGSWHRSEWSRSPGQTGCGTARRLRRGRQSSKSRGGWSELWGCGYQSPAGCDGRGCLWEKRRVTGSSFPPIARRRTSWKSWIKTNVIKKFIGQSRPLKSRKQTLNTTYINYYTWLWLKCDVSHLIYDPKVAKPTLKL